MAEENLMPVIPKAESIYIHTGNISLLRHMQKVNQEPNIEVYECFSSCLQRFAESQNKTELQYVSAVECLCSKSVDMLHGSEESRSDLKLTIKVFLTTAAAEALKDALLHLTASLGVTYIDTLLISFPLGVSSTKIKEVWSQVEDLVSKEVVVNAGVCDMDKNELEELYDWAQIKPTTDQVNLASCCVMPPELIQYAAERDIQLLTHNDPPEIFTNEALSQMISEEFTVRDSQNWNLQWVTRYTVLVKCRGIIKSKGYAMRALRDIRGQRAF